MWPVRRRTTRPAAGMLRLSISAGSGQPFVLVGDQQDRSLHLGQFLGERVEGRAADLDAARGQGAASEECPASASANSAQPRGFLFWN
jgi:hypothetical protein